MSTTITPKLEQSIYSMYRRELTRLRKAAQSRTARAAQRRQDARRLCVEHFSVPFAEVKRIVAEHDAAAGVEHPHTPAYALRLEALKSEEVV